MGTAPVNEQPAAPTPETPTENVMQIIAAKMTTFQEADTEYAKAGAQEASDQAIADDLTAQLAAAKETVLSDDAATEAARLKRNAVLDDIIAAAMAAKIPDSAGAVFAPSVLAKPLAAQ